MTPFVLLFDAFAASLRALLDRDALAIGTTASLRDQVGLEDVFGPVFSWLPLRAVAGEDPRAAVREALDRRWLPQQAIPVLEAPTSCGLDLNVNLYDLRRAAGSAASGWAGAAVEHGGLTWAGVPLADAPVRRPYAINLSLMRLGDVARVGLRVREGLLSGAERQALLDAIVRGLGG